MKLRHLAALLGVVACSGSPEDGELGTAADPEVAMYAISGVRRLPVTVHFVGLPWLLNAAEATGPIVLTNQVGTFVLPTMSSTVTGIQAETVSRAVGYSLSERHDVIAVSNATLSAIASQRLEAYASFDETVWEVRDPATGALLGAGASFNPSGVFFQTVNALHAALPDVGLFGFVPGCEDLECAPVPGPDEERGAGAPERERRVPGFISSTLLSPPLNLNPALPGVVSHQ